LPAKLTGMDYQGRQRRAQSLLAPLRLQTLLVTHPPNIRYLCGFTGSSATLLLNARQCLFFSDGRYTEQARAEVQGARVVIARKAPLTMAAEWLHGHSRGRNRKPATVVGIEGDHLTLREHDRLRKMLGPGFRLRMTASPVEQARMVKDSDEIERMRQSATLGARLFARALEVIRPGVAEAEVAAEMELTARRSGVEGMSFPTIIASGKRSALPHGRASNAVIEPGGFVVCDFGVILTGYCSDMTRTVYAGRPSAEARRVYGAVRQAQLAALETAKPGATTGEVDRAARNVLKKEGLGRYFTHSTGHGVGLEIHEAPRVADGEKTVLCPGMVITVEPGIYIPGKWGVRIEDTVVITEQGCEVLAPTGKELVAV
jgi:Xaa-Pro aminopeptidase